MLKSSHLGCRTPVSSTFLTTKLALKVALREKNTNNVVFKCCVCQSTQKFMLKSPHFWAPRLQDFSSSTFLTLKLALKVVSENTNNVYFEGYYVEQLPQNSSLRQQN